MWQTKLLLCASAAALYLFVPLTSYGQALTIDVLDIGQGDSILIKTAHDHKILIDGGPDQSVLQQLDQVLPWWDRNIDAILPTHPQADHITGLVAVMEHYHVQHVLATPATSTIAAYHQLLQDEQQQHTPVDNFIRGSTLNLDNGLTLSSLWPPANSDWQHVQDLNDVAQVDRLTFGPFSMLFTADAGANIDQQLESDGDNSPVTVLKVPHHGSKTGIDSTYLSELQPVVSVISVGAHNTYGHPAPSTIQQLEQVHSRVYRTDQDGRVEILVNQSGFSVKTAK